MKPQEYFVLGCKLFGVYSLVLGIPALITLLPAFAQPLTSDSNYNQLSAAVTIATRLIPLIYIAMGVYLIRGGDQLYRLAYSEGVGLFDTLRDKFYIFLKFLGIYLIISYLPSLLRAISSYIAFSQAPRYFDMSQEKQNFYLNIASSVWGVASGIYLLKSGHLIVNVALKSLPNAQSES